MEWEGSQLVLIRHAPIAEAGRLCGRTDLSARIDATAIAPLAKWVAGIDAVVASPARRCRETARAIWPRAAKVVTDARLWEQDFGAHDGMPIAELPDLGARSGTELAAYRPPGGESFDDLCVRVAPAIAVRAKEALAIARPVALVVHAGVIRAALALVLGHRPAGLAFEVAPLSVTRLRVGEDGPVSVIEANRVIA